MKNWDKTTANYAKYFTRKKGKSFIFKPKNSKNLETSLVSRYKFYKKNYSLNEYYHLEVKYYYCHNISHITKFCKK